MPRHTMRTTASVPCPDCACPMRSSDLGARDSPGLRVSGEAVRALDHIRKAFHRCIIRGVRRSGKRDRLAARDLLTQYGRYGRWAPAVPHESRELRTRAFTSAKRGKGMWRLRVIAATLLAAAGGCTTILAFGGGEETSRAAEPPATWESAILFQFPDSLTDSAANYAARVEFDGERGAARRTVTGRDVYLAEGNFHRTPWHRLRVAESRQLVLRVVLNHPHEGRTVAEYPLTVTRDEFYYVMFAVGTVEPDPLHRPLLVRELRKYAVPAEARREPSDSLWIGYYTRGRYCFMCPS